jgi:hypothetical protein
VSFKRGSYTVKACQFAAWWMHLHCTRAVCGAGGGGCAGQFARIGIRVHPLELRAAAPRPQKMSPSGRLEAQLPQLLTPQFYHFTHVRTCSKCNKSRILVYSSSGSGSSSNIESSQVPKSTCNTFSPDFGSFRFKYRLKASNPLLNAHASFTKNFPPPWSANHAR